MGEMRVNFAEVETSTFEPVPEGKYPVIIERVEVRESKSSDNDYLNWELKITDEEYEEQRLWMITSLSPKAMFRLKDLLIALDVIDGEEDDFPIVWDDEVDITPKEGPVLTDPDVTGLEATAVVRNEMYEGKEQNRVEELYLGEAEEKPKRSRKSSSSTNGKSGAKKSTSRAKSSSGAKKGRRKALR